MEEDWEEEVAVAAAEEALPVEVCHITDLFTFLSNAIKPANALSLEISIIHPSQLTTGSA